MSKKNITLSVIIFFILIISVIGVFQISKTLADGSKKNVNTQLMTEEEKLSLNLYRLGNYEVVSRDATGKIASYRFLNLKEEIPIALEWMTESEKTEREIDPSSRVQVLARNTNGKISAYRLVMTDADIIAKY